MLAIPLVEIGRFEPSSKVCSSCGNNKKGLNLSIREWTCNNGHKLDRDLNAAYNIKNFGVRDNLYANVSH
ncbi:zinc ribbon domain-containing protein [Galbibacter sp.]|uniref:zinc ribbon domain-containing protein n=1 Tax=Galbibacter sp. TaxID=2918471 RepID=UPI003A8E1DCA